jgi:hypothetical protein
MVDQKQAKLSVGDNEYIIADLSDEAKTQLESLRYAELEIQRLNRELAMISTARNAYNQALLAALPTNKAATKKNAGTKKGTTAKKSTAAKKKPAAAKK